MQGDILKEMHRTLRGDAARYRVVRPGQNLEPLPADRLPGQGGIEGRVAAKGIHDELRGSFFAVVETPAGGGYRLPLDVRAAQQIQVGDIVSAATYSRGAVGRGNLRRGRPVRETVLVRKVGSGLDEQVASMGPVWLDGIGDRPLAPYGFGAEVRRALERRADRQRELGVEVDPRKVGFRAAEVERRAVGRQVAEQNGRVFEAETPDGFRGRLDLVRGPSGTPYAVVANVTRVVVLRAERAWNARVGRDVTVTRDRAGRLQFVGLDPER